MVVLAIVALDEFLGRARTGGGNGCTRLYSAPDLLVSKDLACCALSMSSASRPNCSPTTPRLAALGQARSWRSPLPAVTCTSQATMLTGLAPASMASSPTAGTTETLPKFAFGNNPTRWYRAKNCTRELKQPNYSGGSTSTHRSSGARLPNRTTAAMVRRSSVFSTRPIATWSGTWGHFPFKAFWGPKAGLPSASGSPKRPPPCCDRTNHN